MRVEFAFHQCPCRTVTYHRGVNVGIVGGGIIGCATAWELSRNGVDVTVYDGRPVAGGATHASAGVLAPYLGAHDPGPLQPLIVRSCGLFDAFVRRVRDDAGVAIEYSRCGSIEVALDETEADSLSRFAAMHAAAGARWVDGDALRRLEPAIAGDPHGGVVIDEHGYVAAPELTAALAVAASVRGVSFIGERVTRVNCESAQPAIRTVAGQSSRFDRIIIAAGSWSSQLAPGTTVRAVYPVKGQLLRLKWPAPKMERIVWTTRCYIVPRQGGHVLVGATMDDVGFDERVTEAATDQLLSAAHSVLQMPSGAGMVEARVGLRPATLDGLPIVGCSRTSDAVIFATGHFRNGIALAPLTASLVTDLVLGRALDPALDPLSPKRFGL